jgi:tryptophanyl-tRNA synthetase
VKLQGDAAPRDELIFSVVGWHALTLPQDPKQLASARMDMLAVLLAIGINPDRSIIFHQDHVRGDAVIHPRLKAHEIMKNPCHTELAWILSCMSPFGRLRRMTTWKVNTFCSLTVSCLITLRQSRLAASRNVDDESKMTESFLNVGLFIYPILQAADILIYKLGVISLRFSHRFYLSRQSYSCTCRR